MKVQISKEVFIDFNKLMVPQRSYVNHSLRFLSIIFLKSEISLLNVTYVTVTHVTTIPKNIALPFFAFFGVEMENEMKCCEYIEILMTIL